MTNSDGTRDYGRPQFSFYEDAGSPVGARALRGGTSGCRIYFGLTLIRDEFRARPDELETVISGFLAHEWAHAFQYKSALDEKMFIWETHADYLAGWYIGVKKAHGGSINPEAFFKALYSRGEGNGGDYHYGFPQERSDAAEAGMRFGLLNTRPDRWPDASLAADAGYISVLAMRRRR